jgi:uncharacterized protein
VVEYSNVYKGNALISKAEVATSNWQKCKGLMFSRQKDILFNFRKDAFLKFHMVFVFYPIDIVFMDHDHRIVDLKKKFRPFTCYYSRAKSSHVLELANGTISKHGIELGDLLTVTEKPLEMIEKASRKATAIRKITTKKDSKKVKAKSPRKKAASPVKKPARKTAPKSSSKKVSPKKSK